MKKGTKRKKVGPKRKQVPEHPQEIVSAQLYAAVIQALEAGWSVNAIAKETGVSQPALQEWVSGATGSIKQQTSNALCAWLGMRLTDPIIPERE